jgi:hypothetical protein
METLSLNKHVCDIFRKIMHELGAQMLGVNLSTTCLTGLMDVVFGI